MTEKLLIDLVNAQHANLLINNWQVDRCSKTCVIGKNGAGKQYLDKILMAEATFESAQKCILPNSKSVAVISFETMQAVYEHELKIDETDIINEIDDGTEAREFLPASQLDHPLIEQFSMCHVLDKGYRLLSTGESRKLLILQAILRHVETGQLALLLCDNPFDSLDQSSVIELSRLLSIMDEYGVAVMLCLSNRGDIPTWCEKIAMIEDGDLTDLSHLTSSQIQLRLAQLMRDEIENSPWPMPSKSLKQFTEDTLVKLRDGRVSYNGKVIFENVDFTIKPLQHTLITGANGCGKSTLLQLVTGDHPQCYSNSLRVLGFERGQGETIWQVKKQMGIVSPEIHRQYRVSCDVISVVLSGFFDSIGLYQQVESWQRTIATQWLQKIGMNEHSKTVFSQLSYGEQRLVLIVRALIKTPWLLILDEPTQGLDEVNRHRVLAFLQTLEQQQHSTILFVSHRLDEQLPLFQQHFKM